MLCALLWCVVACVVLSAPAFAGTASWSITGGGGAYVPAFAIAPDRSGVIYAATLNNYNFVFHRSDDWGNSWKQVGQKLFCTDQGPYSLAVDPRNHSVVYACGCGFTKSTDGGETWTQPLSSYNGNWLIGRLVLDPYRPDRLIVTNSVRNPVTSTDGGLTWDAPPIFNKPANALVFDPGDPNRAYLANNSAVWRSTDGGATWYSITGYLYDYVNPAINFQGVAVGPKNTSTLYTWTGTTVYRTVDQGAHWTEQNTFAKMNFRPSKIVCSTTDAGRLYALAGSDGIFTSADAGKTWTSLNLNLPFEVGAVDLLLEGSPERLWLGSGHGLFSKTAGPGLWQSHNGTFGSFSRVLASAKTDPRRLYASGSYDFFRSSDGGLTWFPIRLQGVVGSVVTHPVNSLRAWLVVNAGASPDNRTEIHETTDGGLNWRRVDSGGLPMYGGPAPRMIGDRTDPSFLYLAVGGSLLKSADYGKSWAELQPDCDGTILAQDFSANPVLYISRQDTRLARSTDRGQTWEDLPEAGAFVSSLAIDPRHPDTLYSVSFYSQINRSTDGGKSWEIMRPGGWHSRMTALTFDPSVDGVLYAADESNSICVSRDKGRTWAPFEPEFPPTDLPLDFLVSADERLYVGTAGAVWQIDLGHNLDFVFPQIGDGEAPGAGSLQTTLQLMNQGNPTEALVKFFDSAGKPLSLALGTRPASAEHRIPLARGQSFSATTPGMGPLSVGYARVSGGPGLAGAAVYSYLENSTMLFQAGVPSSFSTFSFGLFFDVSSSEDNGFALANTSDVTVDPRLTLFDSEGHAAGARKLSEVVGHALKPGEHLARYVSEVFPELRQQGVQTGVIAVQSEQPVAPVSLRQNDQPGVGLPQDVWTLSAFPVLPNLSVLGNPRPFCCNRYSGMVFPQVVDGVDGEVQVQTILRLARTGEGSDEFIVRFVESDGSPMDVELEGPDVRYDEAGSWWWVTLKPGCSTTLRTKGSGPLKVGYATVSGSRLEIFGTAFYSWKQNGVKLFETGVPASEALTDFSIFFDSEPGLVQTGLAMVSMGDADANLTFRLYDRAGQLKASRTWPSYLVNNPAGDHGHKARFVHEIVPGLDLLDVRGGILTVHSDQPVAAVTLRQRDDAQRGFPDDLYLITVFPVIPGRHDD